MGYYQDVYLKSEEWKSLRKEVIIKDGFRCRLCGVRPKGGGGKMKRFQVHHVQYRNLHDVEYGDLKTLCPACHAAVHALMRKYPKMKNLPRKIQWQTVVYHLRPERRMSLSGLINGLDESGKQCRQKEKTKRAPKDQFLVLRGKLIQSGKVISGRMKWRESFEENPIILAGLKGSTYLISAYIEATMDDPRLLIPVLYKPKPVLTLPVHAQGGDFSF